MNITKLVSSIGFLIFAVLQSPVSVNAADVLFVGDSHSTGCLGSELDKAIHSIRSPKTGAQVSVSARATCGSTTAGWLSSEGTSTTCGFRTCDTSTCPDYWTMKTPKGHADSLSTQLSATQPKVTVVELGTNMMLKNDLETAMDDVRSTIRMIHKNRSECVWLGPPQARVSKISLSFFEKFIARLEQEVTNAGCRYIDSAKKTDRENISDPAGLHYTCEQSKVWAAKVSRELTPAVESLLSVPDRNRLGGATITR